jgi:Flp pilus assembly protein TadG
VNGRRKRSLWSRGQTAVEFSTVAATLLLFTFGVMMMGEAVMSYNSMSAAAEEAVRYAVANGPNSPVPATTAQIQQIAINTASQLPLTTSNVNVSWITDPTMATRQDARVVVSYNYPLKIPWMSSITLHLSATSQMMASQ